MKVRCIKDFAFTGKEHKVDDELTVTKEELALLINQRLCVMCKEETPKEKATVKKKIEKAVK